MSNPTIPPELRCFEVVIDPHGWQDSEGWYAFVEVSRYESLVQLRHRVLPLVIDLDWYDPDGRSDEPAPPSRTGLFRLRVVMNENWENPIDGMHIDDADKLNAAMRRMIERHG